MKARFGARAANQRFQARFGKRVLTSLMELVQIDHTQADIDILSDDERREVIGRPWVTLAIDLITRCIVGFYLSLDAPSMLSVGMCLMHTLLPKDDWLKERSIDAEWSYYGRMEALGADNGREFLGYSMARGCDELKIILRIRGVGRQYKHGHIERLMGTSMSHVHGLPGTTFSNPKEKGDYDSEARATMTLAELEAWLVHDICYSYHHSFHEGIGTTPAAKWDQEYKRAMAQGASAPTHLQPVSLSNLEVLASFLPQVERRVTRSGVQVNRVFYKSDALLDRVGTRKTYPFKYDPRDITVVYGRDDSGALCRLIPTDPTIKRMSVYEWDRHRAQGRAVAKSDHSLGMRAKGAKEQETIERSSLKKTRKARKESAREAERMKGSARVHGPGKAPKPRKSDQARKDVFSAPVPTYRTEEWTS